MSMQPTHSAPGHDGPATPMPPAADVVVVGGGLAGLVAAVSAARSGATVVLCDAGTMGGRARVQVVEPGVTFNGGPRALYRGGAAARELAALGVRWGGGTPPARGGRVSCDGHLHRMPGTAAELLGTKALGLRSKVRIGMLLGTIGRVRAERHVGTSVREWVDGLGLAPDAAGLLHAVVRLATYVDRPDELDAGAAITQVQLALGAGVTYLDRGWGTLVDALVAQAGGCGVTTVPHRRVQAVRPADGRWCVELAGGATVRAGAVVLASGTPAAAQGLSPVPVGSAGLGAPVTAACWELAVRGAVPVPFLLGLDEPCYLSRHSPPARLAPEGVQVVHALRYGATDPDADRAQLAAFVARAGIDRDQLVADRFLRRMVVSGGVPTAASGGLAGRPAVQVRNAPGLHLAGDWVGDEGLLADAAVASGVLAGTAAAQHAIGPGRAATPPVGSGWRA